MSLTQGGSNEPTPDVLAIESKSLQQQVDLYKGLVARQEDHAKVLCGILENVLESHGQMNETKDFFKRMSEERRDRYLEERLNTNTQRHYPTYVPSGMPSELDDRMMHQAVLKTALEDPAVNTTRQLEDVFTPSYVTTTTFQNEEYTYEMGGEASTSHDEEETATEESGEEQGNKYRHSPEFRGKI